MVVEGVMKAAFAVPSQQALPAVVYTLSTPIVRRLGAMAQMKKVFSAFSIFRIA